MPERSGRAVKRRTVVGGRAFVAVLAAVIATAGPPDRLSAQTPPESLPPARTVRDTTHQVGPAGALWRSLLVPGWGQAATGRHVTGALFVVWEGTTMYMTLKARQEADYFRTAGLPNQTSKRQEVQDWMVLWIFNHLFAGAEAYVAAHLRDFPRELRVRALPSGVGVSFPFPHP
jgi:hypothetical protein